MSNDFARTMNKIIFDTFLEEQAPPPTAPNQPEIVNTNNDYYPRHLKLPPKTREKEVPQFGMMELERSKGVKEIYMFDPRQIHSVEPKEFNETFRDFCFASLYIKEEVIRALQEIRYECNKVLDMPIFNFDIPEAMHLDQFKHIQESAVSQLVYNLKGQWVEGMIKIIKTQFEKVGKGWFNMKETSKITYDFGKLKRFLTLVRLMM